MITRRCARCNSVSLITFGKYHEGCRNGEPKFIPGDVVVLKSNHHLVLNVDDSNGDMVICSDYDDGTPHVYHESALASIWGPVMSDEVDDAIRKLEDEEISRMTPALKKKYWEGVEADMGWDYYKERTN